MLTDIYNNTTNLLFFCFTICRFLYRALWQRFCFSTNIQQQNNVWIFHFVLLFLYHAFYSLKALLRKRNVFCFLFLFLLILSISFNYFTICVCVCLAPIVFHFTVCFLFCKPVFFLVTCLSW